MPSHCQAHTAIWDSFRTAQVATKFYFLEAVYAPWRGSSRVVAIRQVVGRIRWLRFVRAELRAEQS